MSFAVVSLVQKSDTIRTQPTIFILAFVIARTILRLLLLSHDFDFSAAAVLLPVHRRESEGISRDLDLTVAKLRE